MIFEWRCSVEEAEVADEELRGRRVAAAPMEEVQLVSGDWSGSVTLAVG